MRNVGASFYSGCSIPFEDFIAFSKSIGLDWVEIQAEHPFTPAELSSYEREQIVGLLASYEMTPTVHGPLHDVNLSSLKEQIRIASVNIAVDCVELSRDIGAPILVLHAGTCPRDLAGSMLEESRTSFLTSMMEIAPLAQEMGVRIGIENKQAGADREIVLHPEEHLGFVETLKEYGVGAVLDVGHANTTGCDLVEYARTLGQYLIELHVHDNEGVSDDHLALGRGTVKFPLLSEVLIRIGFKGPVIIELKTKQDLESAVRYLDKNHLAPWKS